MSKQDLKHAIISLVLGVLTIALTDLLNGFLGILKEWLITSAGGAVTTGAYLKMKHFL